MIESNSATESYMTGLATPPAHRIISCISLISVTTAVVTITALTGITATIGITALIGITTLAGVTTVVMTTNIARASVTGMTFPPGIIAGTSVIITILRFSAIVRVWLCWLDGVRLL
jgi:hypothetical protein